MRLSEFITSNTQSIISEWESFAKTLTPAAHGMSELQLKDHIPQLLKFIARDIDTAQTASEQVFKSQGGSDNTPDKINTAAESHGEQRHASGFNIVQMVSEYRALRSSIVKLWTESKDSLNTMDILDLTRFNEAIDQILAESVARFTEKVDYSKGLLLGVLSHDIRTPLGAIKMLAHLMPTVGTLNQKHNEFLSQIGSCSVRANSIVADLLDLTRARIGTGLTVVRQPMDISGVAKEIIAEIQVLSPNRAICFESSGDISGEWDAIRLGQVFTNLIGNAIQYGVENKPISVTIIGEASDVIIAVHNECEPIPAAQLLTLFDSFTRGERGNSQSAKSNLGLGLFITREIVLSHQGSLDVISNDNEGTTFRIRLPKKASAD